MNQHDSKKIKGIAILVMLLHHLFPLAWGSISGTWLFSVLGKVFDAFKICVAMYAFLTGYGYFFAKKKRCFMAQKEALCF